METERVKISQLQVNEQNPRTCTDKQFEKLVRSVITFPKMLEVRPIVVGEGGVALGGNMRLRALQAIATMTDGEIMSHIEQSAKYNGRPEVEREALLRYWQKWQHDPMVSVVRTDNMTEDERREFIIKDNVGFGAWDWDMLANDWDTDELDDWGLSAWVEQPTDDKEGGQVKAISQINEAAKMGDLTHKQAHDMREAIREACSTRAGFTKQSPLITELNVKINEVSRFFQ